MRTISHILLSIVLVIIVSCSKSDDSEPSQQQQQQDPDPDPSIVGTWNLTSLNFHLDETETNPDGSQVFTVADGVGFNLDATNTFSENPNTVIDAGAYDLELTIQVENNTPFTVINENLQLANGNGTWTLENTTLSISSGTFQGSGTITQLTANSLQYSLNFTEEYQQGAVEVLNEITFNYSFSRQ